MRLIGIYRRSSAVIILLLVCAQADAQLLFSKSESQAMKTAIAAKDPRVQAAAERLRRDADARLKDGPWSVTFNRPKDRKIPVNDYYSEAPYWWPDPANPGGPFIRKDGETNRARFLANREDLGRVSQAVFLLGTAAWLFDDQRYADHASKLLAVWFVDPATRMNPHLEYGQAISGITDGRGIGIIDTTNLIWAVQGITFLDATGRWKPSDRVAVRKWFSDYLGWISTDKKGLDEKGNGNNHSSWWAAQAASYAVFLGDRDTQDAIWRMYREELIPKQMLADGSCPREESRTKSLGYSAFNLDALAVVCRLAEKQGVDLWRFRAKNGAGMPAGVAYLAPFMAHPETWKKPQIEPFQNDRIYFLALAGLGLNAPEHVAAWKTLRRPVGTWFTLLDLLLDTTPRQ